MGRGVLRKRAKERYRFIRARTQRFPVSVMCDVMQVHRSGYYAWLKKPHSDRALQDQRLKASIKACWEASGGYHGYRNIQLDLKGESIVCGRDRVLRLMQSMRLCAVRHQTKLKGMYRGKPSAVAANTLDRAFTVSEPNRVWVSDMTYLHTRQGLAFLAVVIDLFSRKVISWSLDRHMRDELITRTIGDAIAYRRPIKPVLFHSDQGG